MSADTHKPSEEVIVGEDDLRWWQELAPTLMWRFAKTMPRSPHSYVVQGDGNGLSKEDYRRAARVIWTYGRPATYNGGWKLYLDAPAPSPERTPNLRRPEHHAGEMARYWVGDQKPDKAYLINMAVSEDVWDDGTAPQTETGTTTFYDGLATVYDEMYEDPGDVEENAQVRSLVNSLLGVREHAPTTLDIGAGTGLLLDLDITSAHSYTGVDPSRGMLNRLFSKHSKVRTLIPMTAAEALPELRAEERKYDLVASLFGSASYIDPDDVDHALSMVDDEGVAVFMVYTDGYAPEYYEGEERSQVLDNSRLIRERMQERMGEATHRIGRFDVWAVRR